MEKQGQDLGCRVSALEENFTEDRKTVRELQTEVQGLKFSLEKALNSLMPKIDSLLSDRTGTVNTVSTVGANIAVTPFSVVAPFAANEKGKEEYIIIEEDISTTSSMPRYSATSVLKAAETGDIETLLSHLKSGTSANKRYFSGFTLLHLAVSGGQVKTVKALLDAGASVDARALSYRTSLHLAAEKGFLNIVQMLLDAGADSNAKDAGKVTPLILAAQGGHSDIAKILIEKGASLNDCVNRNKTALWYAVERGANDLVKILCVKNRQKSDSVGLALKLASERGNAEAVTLLLKCKNRPNNNAIWRALSNANDICVVFAFEDTKPGILKSREAVWAMHWANMWGRYHTVEALEDAGVIFDASLIPL